MEENRKNYIIRLLIGIITVIAIIILICFLCAKCAKKENTGDYAKVWETNINKMLESAKNYYQGDKLPVNINDTKTMDLKTMLDLEVINPFKDSENQFCDSEKSYVTITKSQENQYDLTAKLVCNKKSGEKKDVIQTNGTKYTVIFNTDGGSTIDKQVVNSGALVSRPTDPSKTGYTFAGWYLENDIFNFDTRLTQDITLTAKWVKNQASNPSNPGTAKQFYYEHAPLVKNYLSDWTFTYPTNATTFETMKKEAALYEWHKTDSEQIYTVSTFTQGEYDQYKDEKGNFTLTYTIILNNFSATEHFKFASRQTSTITTTSSFQEYKDHRSNISLLGNNPQNTTVPFAASDMSRASIRSGNYKYEISKPYVQNNKVVVDIKIVVNGLGSTKPYTGTGVSQPTYFVGVSFYASKSYVNEKYISDDGFHMPSNWTSSTRGEYLGTKELTYYRPYTYKMDLTKTIWSTKSQVDGYQPTGRTKWA